MAKIPAKWRSILTACAHAYEHDSNLSPREWLQENHPDEKWRTAEKYLTVPKLLAYLAGDIQEQKPAPGSGPGASPQSPKRAPKKSGGQPGNNNATKHGIYSRFLTADDVEVWQEAYELEHIQNELALARVQLARAMRKQAEIQQARSVDDTEGKPSTRAMETTEYEVRMDSMGGSEGWKKTLPDVDAIIDRCLARIAQLMTLRNQLAQAPVLNRMEQLAMTQAIMAKLEKGDITAVEAGIKLEAQLIPLPATLSMMIRAELMESSEEEIETGGVSGEEVKARAAQLRAEKLVAKEEFLKKRRLEMESLNAEMGIG